MLVLRTADRGVGLAPPPGVLVIFFLWMQKAEVRRVAVVPVRADVPAVHAGASQGISIFPYEIRQFT